MLVRPSRVIYVENDPALRGIMTQMLSAQEELDVILSSGSPREVLASVEVQRADVALLDLALGAGEMNGVELGIALRELNSELGIVIHSQYPLDFATERVPRDVLIGWSTMPKTGDLRIEDVTRLLRSTATGLSNVALAEGEGQQSTRQDADTAKIKRLSARQRLAMSLVRTGMSAPQIAEQLGLTQEAVRQDLSRAYRILVPNSTAGDRRTEAVLEYIRLTQDPGWDAP